MTDQPAILGGPPVREVWLPYGHHAISDEDIAAVIEVLRSDWITQGPKVEELEHAVADYCETKYAVAFSSGTAALHAACVTAGLGPGDEAITTPLTFVATANAVIYCGAKPVFADIREDTLGLDPLKFEQRITSKTKAVLPVDYAGHPADLESILGIARRHGITVIEDAAHALGAEYDKRPIGSISDMTVFSFHPVKQITTGEGGMVLTNDANLAEHLRVLRHHGIVYADPQSPWKYQIKELGYNYRITDFQCALGLSRLRKLKEQIKRRQEIAAHYQEAFLNVREVSVPKTAPNVMHAWHLFVLLLNLEWLSVDRDNILRDLRAENIGATVHYPLVHCHPFYRDRFGTGSGMCPVAEAIFDRLITLPMFAQMSLADVDDVVVALEAILRCYRR